MTKNLYFYKSLKFDVNKTVTSFSCFIVFVVVDIKSTLNISDTDVSKFTLTSDNIVWTHFIFLF